MWIVHHWRLILWIGAVWIVLSVPAGLLGARLVRRGGA